MVLSVGLVVVASEVSREDTLEWLAGPAEIAVGSCLVLPGRAAAPMPVVAALAVETEQAEFAVGAPLAGLGRIEAAAAETVVAASELEGTSAASEAVERTESWLELG